MRSELALSVTIREDSGWTRINFFPHSVWRVFGVCIDEWTQLHGMTFAPEKCFVVAKDPMTLNLGPDILPSAQSAKYLGILMTASGPDWKSMAEKLSEKTKNAVMALMKVGFNRTAWSPSAKIDDLIHSTSHGI